jgi:hypothetical protein
MGWTIRAATDDDIPALVRADWAAFSGQPDETQIADSRAFLEVDRTWAAVDGDRIVGAGGAISLELTVPGPVTVPTAGVTTSASCPPTAGRASSPP